MVNIELIKQLREETGGSPTDIKKALDESNGDIEKTKELLKAWGAKSAGKKEGREAHEGAIDYYLHPNAKVGVLLDIRCETDFVAKSADFKQLAHELCLHIAAVSPMYVSEASIPEEIIETEKKTYQEQVAGSGKPQNIVDQIIEGKLKKFKESVALMSQMWVKDDTKSIKNLIDETIAKTGERIEVKRFVRYEI